MARSELVVCVWSDLLDTSAHYMRGQQCQYENLMIINHSDSKTTLCPFAFLAACHRLVRISAKEGREKHVKWWSNNLQSINQSVTLNSQC